MKESSTYQAILEEGRAEGRLLGALAQAKKLLRRRGDKAFGPPDKRTAKVIEQHNDLTQLEDWFMGVETAASWQELLGQSASSRRSGRRPRPS